MALAFMSGGNASTVFIDPKVKAIHYYALTSGDIRHEMQSYRSVEFSEDFYRELTAILQGFLGKYTPASAASSSIVLPDSAVVTDVLTIPAMQPKAMKNSVEATLEGLFKNRRELTIRTPCVLQNKQFSVYGVAGVRSSLVSSVRAAGASARFPAKNISFAAETSAVAASILNPKLKGASYLLLDIKDSYARITYIYKGSALGSAILPFGYEIMEKPRVAAEDMLFDHTVAELAVLNARERAKAKALTVIDSDGREVTENDLLGDEEGEENLPTSDPEKHAESETDDGENPFSGNDNISVDRSVNTIKVLPKKVPRKLPKNLQRPLPSNEQEYADENFRLFAKWVLGFIQDSERVQPLGGIDSVYVNLPAKLNQSVENFNAEQAGSGVSFFPIGISGHETNVCENLEMYGGLFIGKARNQIVF